MKISTDKLKDNQINLNWMKPSKLDNFLECSVIITRITTDKLKDNQINLEWMKPSKLDQCLEVGFVAVTCASWLLILGLILFC